MIHEIPRDVHVWTRIGDDIYGFGDGGRVTSTRLSICIPTWNREAYLKGLLTDITKQLHADPSLPDLVELVIVDGGSTDRTQETVRESCNPAFQITCFRRTSRSGIDADILKCAEIAHGDYCWFFSDDDRMQPGSLRHVVDRIAAYSNLAGCFVNRYSFDSSMEHRVAEIKLWPSQILKEEVLLEQKDRCFEALGIDLGFISSQVVKRNLWQEVIGENDLSDYFNCYLMVHVIGLMMNKSARWLYIDRPLVLQRTGNDSFLARDGFLKRQIMEHSSFAEVIGAHYPRGSRMYRRIFKKMVLRLPRVAANIKSFGVDYSTQAQLLRLYWRRYASYPAFWIRVFPIFLLPNVLCSATKKMYFRHLRRTRTGPRRERP